MPLARSVLVDVSSSASLASRNAAAGSPAKLSMRSPRNRRSGFTLLEVMIATAVTLLMMVSLAQIFKVIGDSMKQGRAVLELNNQLRSVVYRVQTDLKNLTAFPDPPTDPSAATGYLKVYDGSLTDYSAAIYSSAAGVSVNLSRFGDVDDILMGTIRAGDVWFTGKVPLFVLRKDPPTAADLDGNGFPDDIELVSIASQYAEVVMFVEPEVTNVGNVSQDPAFYLTNGPLSFRDADNADGSANGFPDAFRIHYRTLLIRPDLNLPAGVLPAGTVVGEDWLYAQPQSGLPSPLCDMSPNHNQCDLSIRRVFNPSDGLAPTVDFVAANSLEDLMDPANRFAHVQVPIAGTSSTTMPLLALGPKLPLPASTITAGDPNGQLGTGSFQVGTGFLHPAYILRGIRAGEDVLASNVLAFDIKCFDPGVPLLGDPGPDGGVGIANSDDDGDGNADNPAELGWAGSDDLVLSPNDPGYAAALVAVPPASSVGTGEYVDVAWARKLAAHGASLSAAMNLWSPMSGYSSTNFGVNGNFSDELYKSGLVLRSGTTLQVLQPSYDTWTTRYEGDGNLQAYRGTLVGNLRINGAIELYGINNGDDRTSAMPVWRQMAIDAGTDGIDNMGSAPGIDDVTELETSAPIPTRLRGVKVSVRMEDPVTRQVKQMSAAREFVTE